MSTNKAVIDGVELAQLDEFATHAKGNPADVQFGLSARARYEGTCAHSLGKIDGYVLGGESIERETRSYTIPYGGWKEVLNAGGWVSPTDRPEPIEVALSALAACINVGISVNAVANGVEIDTLHTTVSTDFDPSVLFSLADLKDSEQIFQHLEANVNVSGEDVDPDMIDEWARRAPVYTLLSLAQDINLTVDSPMTISLEDGRRS